MSFEVLKAGFLTSLQDQGRHGAMIYGMAPSGALDEHAYRWGNYLLGNRNNAPSLEITIGQCALKSHIDCDIVVTGANLNFHINEVRAPNWQVCAIKAGDVLSWQKPLSGVRAYLAVRGGFDAPQYFGSCAVNQREGIGSLIHKGDILNIKPSGNRTRRAIPRRFIPNYNAPLTLGLIVNRDISVFSDDQYRQLFNTSWRITSQNGRTAYQLDNDANIIPKTFTMVSEPNDEGSVQITHGGKAIIMLKDLPTIGGYPKIGTVYSLDRAKLAQKTTQQYLRFTPITLAQAQAKRQQFDAFFSQ